MSEKEKDIIVTIGKALPNMSERDKGYCLMTEAPTPADTKQLEELGLEVVTEEK